MFVVLFLSFPNVNPPETENRGEKTTRCTHTHIHKKDKKIVELEQQGKRSADEIKKLRIVVQHHVVLQKNKKKTK